MIARPSDECCAFRRFLHGVWEGRAYAPHMRNIVLVSLAVLALTGCSAPILVMRDIPPGVATDGVVFHRTKWFDCAVAVYQLQPDFVARLRAEGLAALSGGTTVWKQTPVPDDMSKATANLDSTLNCLDEAKSYRDIFENAAHGHGAYFTVNQEGGTDILAPADGLLLLGGYE